MTDIERLGDIAKEGIEAVMVWRDRANRLKGENILLRELLEKFLKKEEIEPLLPPSEGKTEEK